MHAITMEAGRLRFRDDHAHPTVANDETLVRVSQAGICETDLHLARGYMGFEGILGHEFVGIAQSGPLAGRRVVGEINCNCRRCPRCKTGLGNHCEHRTVIGIDRHDGAFAERIAVPDHNLHAIPDSISDDEAVFVEPLAAAFRILEQVTFADADRVIVLGDGRLAYFCAQTVATAVDRLRVVGKHASKLQRFGRLGIETVELDNLPIEKTFDVVIDCTGSASGLPLALSLVRPCGTIVMKTTVADQHQLSLAPIVIDEVNLVGSRCGPFDVAIDALKKETIDVKSLITDRFSLTDAEQAFARAAAPDAFKVVFDIQQGRPSDGQ